jgi:hypothetical protein
LRVKRACLTTSLHRSTDQYISNGRLTLVATDHTVQLTVAGSGPQWQSHSEDRRYLKVRNCCQALNSPAARRRSVLRQSGIGT